MENKNNFLFRIYEWMMDNKNHLKILLNTASPLLTHPNNNDKNWRVQLQVSAIKSSIIFLKSSKF